MMTIGNPKGYTLVETVITVALLSVILLGAYGVLHTGNVVVNKDLTLLDMQQQTRNAIDRIVREVRQASSQTITTNYNSTTNDKIAFKIPQIAIGTQVKYYLSGTNLVREDAAGATQNIASNINLLKFTLAGSLLQIQVRADKTMFANTISFPLIEKVRLRNE